MAVAAASPTAKDGSPTLPPENDMGLRPDRALSRSGAPVPSGSSDLMAGDAYRAAERAGRHSVSSGGAFSAEYERGDVTEAAEPLLPLGAPVGEPF